MLLIRLISNLKSEKACGLVSRENQHPTWNLSVIALSQQKPYPVYQSKSVGYLRIPAVWGALRWRVDWVRLLLHGRCYSVDYLKTLAVSTMRTSTWWVGFLARWECKDRCNRYAYIFFICIIRTLVRLCHGTIIGHRLSVLIDSFVSINEDYFFSFNFKLLSVDFIAEAYLRGDCQ